MRKIHTLLLAVMALWVFTSTAAASGVTETKFTAALNGANELPANASTATGKAVFYLNEGETQLHFKLIVYNLYNPVAAHIHCGAAGANGPVGVTLFSGGTPGAGRFQGLLSHGVATAPDAGNRCGWTSLSDVVAAIESGGAYVNVHTNDGVAPTNTGPGDLASGEIRGQVE